MAGNAQPRLDLAAQGSRLAAFTLDIVLFWVTLGVGWLLWYLVLAARGQSPAKQIVGIHVAYEEGNRVGFWGMLQRDWVLRGFVVGGMFVIVLRFEPSAAWLIGLLFAIAALWCTWDEARQCLWDKVLGTYVVRTKAVRSGRPAVSPVERLARNLEALDDLRTRGLLTEEEYAERRAQELDAPLDGNQSGDPR